ncbi:MAG: hypothetical protein KJO07_11375 [Deltaproteobacteria bacterium]|nr:hypothetical protein [Deltaproteobacteria bacterium]
MALRLALALAVPLLATATATAQDLPTSCAEVHEPASELIARARKLPARKRRGLRQRLARDPGDVHARTLLLAATARAAPARNRANVEWLVATCPAMPLLGAPAIARIASRSLDTLWAQQARYRATAAVLANYWSYRSARKPLNLRPRPTDPRWSAAERQRHIKAYQTSSANSAEHHKLAFKAFEAWRLELRAKPKNSQALLRAAQAAFDAGFQDAAARFGGEYLARWNRAGRAPDSAIPTALEQIAIAARRRGDRSMARSATKAAGSIP